MWSVWHSSKVTRCGTSRTGKQMQPGWGSTDRPCCCVSRSVPYLPPPETQHILSLAHPRAINTGSHCSLCVPDPATPCARAVPRHCSLSLNTAYFLSFLFPPVCKSAWNEVFLCLKQDILKGGYWWHMHFQSLLAGVFLISESLYDTWEFGSKHR